MASSLPAPLKIKEIVPFVTRAVQLEKFKPIISYWCYYYIVDQILAQGLHTASDESMTYTTALMDKLEQFKTEQPDNDAITDDVAAKAYVEQFALETFKRADDAIHSNGASRQTADTFQAASTFIDLLNMSIWRPMSPEFAAKSRYAKYHAIRIIKAIKAGEDPNATNPVSEDTQSQDPVTGMEDIISPPAGYKPPTVESVPESRIPTRPASTAPSAAFDLPSATPLAPAGGSESAALTGQPDDDTARSASVGGGYFPSVPTFTSEAAHSTASTANPTSFDLPSAPTPEDTASPADFYNHPQPPAPAPVPAPVQRTAPPPVVSQPAPLPPVQALPPGNYRTDDDSMNLATKHAKWAISALNFEDVDTAVKELRLALNSLGAQ